MTTSTLTFKNGMEIHLQDAKVTNVMVKKLKKTAQQIAEDYYKQLQEVKAICSRNK